MHAGSIPAGGTTSFLQIGTIRIHPSLPASSALGRPGTAAWAAKNGEGASVDHPLRTIVLVPRVFPDAYGAVRTTCRSVHLSPRCLVQLSLDFIQNMRPVIVPVVLLVTVT